MHDLRGNFFLNGKRRRGKERRKGEGKRGNEGERGGKGGGERGNGIGKTGATRLKTRTRGTESPRTEKGRTERTTKRKRYRDTKDTQGKYRACVRRRTQRRDKREGAKAVKEEEVLRQERRQRKWEDRGIRIGTTNNR